MVSAVLGGQEGCLIHLMPEASSMRIESEGSSRRWLHQWTA